MCTLGLLVIGSIVQGVGAARSARAQGEVHEKNAELLEENALQQTLVGTHDTHRVIDQAARIGGQQRAAAAEGGLDPTGSVSDVMYDTAEEADLDVQAIMFNSSGAAESRMFSADIEKHNASSARSSAGFAFLSPIMRTATAYPSYFGG